MAGEIIYLKSNLLYQPVFHITNLMRFIRCHLFGLRQIAAKRLPRLRISKTLLGKQAESVVNRDIELYKRMNLTAVPAIIINGHVIEGNPGKDVIVSVAKNEMPDL